jgi:hypothetical protein
MWIYQKNFKELVYSDIIMRPLSQICLYLVKLPCLICHALMYIYQPFPPQLENKAWTRRTALYSNS